jgi:hypothetical protein
VQVETGLAFAGDFLADLALAQKIKVIVDQDARGPGTTMTSRRFWSSCSQKFDGWHYHRQWRQWVQEETQHVLRLRNRWTGLTSR